VGVFRSIRPRGPLDRPEEIDGAALEGLVAQHLRAWIAYAGRDATLSFWRTRSGVEVDFVVYGAEVFLAIQVQNAARVRPSDVQALWAFRNDYPESTALLLYRGVDRLRVDDVWCMPVERFLRELHPSRSLTDLIAGAPRTRATPVAREGRPRERRQDVPGNSGAGTTGVEGPAHRLDQLGAPGLRKGRMIRGGNGRTEAA
jgi:hypothetical protein